VKDRDQSKNESGGEAAVRSLMESAGPRPTIPAADLATIRSTARDAWRSRTAATAPEESELRSQWPRWALALAATLLVALGLAGWQLQRSPQALQVVAQLDSASGVLLLERPGAEPRPLTGKSPLTASSWLTSGDAATSPGTAAIRLASGAAMRMDVDTRLQLLSANEVRLERGALYVDTGVDGAVPAGSEPAILVQTPYGPVQDIGTRFTVRVEGNGTPVLSLRVRDGAVAVGESAQRQVAQAGEELRLEGDRVEREEISVYGSGWEWVLEAAPGFQLDGRPLGELLGWVERETGWRIAYASEELAEHAPTIPLFGSMADLRPDEAPFVLLPGADLEGHLEGDVLIISQAAPASMSGRP
jgi:ferric-dicitrate binding protein FerR (iron transport regulator)